MDSPVVPLSVGRGTITASNLQGPMAGKQISDLVNLMKSGQAYVNVHTTQNKNGEIRGQILPVPGNKNLQSGIDDTFPLTCPPCAIPSLVYIYGR